MTTSISTISYLICNIQKVFWGKLLLGLKQAQDFKRRKLEDRKRTWLEREFMPRDVNSLQTWPSSSWNYLNQSFDRHVAMLVYNSLFVAVVTSLLNCSISIYYLHCVSTNYSTFIFI